MRSVGRDPGAFFRLARDGARSVEEDGEEDGAYGEDAADEDHGQEDAPRVVAG